MTVNQALPQEMTGQIKINVNTMVYCNTCNNQNIHVIATPTKTKPKKKTIPSTLKRLVWDKYIGEDFGKSKCYCCKLSVITQMSFHCGHVISDKNGGKIDVDNLRPICQNCNSSMGSTNMDVFIAMYNIHQVTANTV